MRRLETFDWWPELIAMKDTLSLRELAQKFDVTPGAISLALRREGVNRQPAPPGPRPKGNHSDDVLPPEPGEELVAPAKPAKGGKAAGRSNSKDARLMALWDELGTQPDRDIAKKAGTSVRTVASFRARHKIAAYSGPRKGRDAAAPASQSATASGSYAWTVTLQAAKGQTQRVVVAETLVAAASAAESRADGARVLSVSWLGELL